MHPTFTPSALTADELEAVTVGRSTVFDTLVDRIRGAARDGSRPHTLLVAPRGAGKTHTVHVAVHRSLADAETAKAVLPVLIPEDSLAIGSYLDLLVEIARSINDDLAASARDMRRHKDTIGIEQAILSLAGKRMILLTIENLDRVFDGLGAGGQGALRAWVETSTAVTMFATAPMLFAGVSSRSYPWYGSFIVESLPDLTVDDAIAMLSRTARRTDDEELESFVDSTTGRERLQVVHRLAGGSPRLWHLLSEGIDSESLDALVPAVESLLDRLAPYYQQQLWQLPGGEQRLVVELARGWKPRTVTDLAAAVGISNQSAAAALGRLSSTRWVTSSKARVGDQRASWYDLTEPLLRYHLQYREDRGKPLRLIVEFLRGFYSRQRLFDQLADAVPDSPVKRHLQRALYSESNWLPSGTLNEPKALLATLRTWMVHEPAALGDVAIVLESVLLAALGRPAERPVPGHLEQIIANGITAQSHSSTLADKVDVSLRNLRLRDWREDEEDALSVFEFGCSARGSSPHWLDLNQCTALRERHVSKPALMLRLLVTWGLRLDGRINEALATLADALDDVERADGDNDFYRNVMWDLWLETIPAADTAPRTRAGNAEIGWRLAVALQRGRIRADQFDTVMAAFTDDTRSAVAAIVAMAAPALGIEMPAGQDPLEYVDKELLAPIDRFIADLATRSAQQSDS